MRKISEILSESTWGRILDRGAGETVRKEDDINYMSINAFYDYVCSRYDKNERVTNISKETNPEYNKDIVIRPNKDMFVCGRYNGDDIKQIKITLINNGISVLKDFIVPNSPEEWKWKKLQTDCFELELKNGEITNKTFIHLIDFLLGNKIDESIWGEILDRGRGDVERKEEINDINDMNSGDFYKYLVLRYDDEVLNIKKDEIPWTFLEHRIFIDITDHISLYVLYSKNKLEEIKVKFKNEKSLADEFEKLTSDKFKWERNEYDLFKVGDASIIKNITAIDLIKLLINKYVTK